ncbi:sugar-binding protein [Pseudomonas syringae pv. papulans]|nr:sugar-binding protein [Pseudomonas syringae pv. papulans]
MTNGWSYQSPAGQILSFSTQGQLLRIDNSNGNFYILSYRDLGADRAIEIDNGFGQSVQLTEAPMHQLRKATSKTINIDYDYASMQLNKRTTTIGSLISTREYLYEDSRNARLLTGITDERGVRFATWAYDGQYRAVSSQHSGGVGLTMITYNDDDSTTVANELGKKSIFRYQRISGVKRIASIEGEPTPDCPASNSSYTYNDRGLVLTKTDAKGLITTYEYNDRGLEVSRTEASGTTLARTTTTEWDPDRFLPIKVIEPNRVTVYSYDNQGRELTRQSTSR